MKKSKGVAYLLWLLGFFGCLGFHRFYLGRWGTAILWIMTFGLLGIGAFIDLFTLGGKVDMYNLELENEKARQQMRENMMMTTSAISATAAAIAASHASQEATSKQLSPISAK